MVTLEDIELDILTDTDAGKSVVDNFREILDVIGFKEYSVDIGYDYGLRRKEIFGLESGHFFVAKNESIEGIQVKPNNVRDLKSSSSTRLIPSLLSGKQQCKHLIKIVAQTTASPAKKKFIFADPEQRNELYSTIKIEVVVRDALRKATGNYDVVPHSMRHMAATRLAHFAFETPRQITLSKHAEQSIKGSLESKQLFSCFYGGFHSWPFWIDRIAMLLGHADVSTLLNTYWHTSSLRLAEHTWHAATNVPFTGDQIALMLGRDRTSIVHMRLDLLKKIGPSAEHPNNYIPLISHYVSISDLQELGGPNIKAEKKRKNKMPENNSTNDYEDIPITWVVYDRLLCRRLSDGLSLAELEDYAPELGLKKKIASTFIKAYRDIVETTGFDDFEPTNSEISSAKHRRSDGVLRGAVERESRLTAAHKLAQLSESFADTLSTVMSHWAERTNPIDPWFVAKNENEVLSVKNMLNEIGVADNQLEFCQCNFDTSRLRKILADLQPSSIKVQSTRISSGLGGIRVSEFGIRVMQKRKSKVGDYRDTHRLALMLATIIRAESSLSCK